MKFSIAATSLLLAATLTGCINISDWKSVSGSGNVLTEARAVNSFNGVSVSGAGELLVAQGLEESLTIEADDNLLPFIVSEVSHGHLSIGPQNVNLRPTQTIRYRLNVKNLNDLQLSGSVHAEADSIKTDRLALGISGSGRVHVAQLEARTLSIRISGSGGVAVAGRVEKQEIQISGSGSHQAFELKSANARADISGSGHASLWVADLLRAHISGSGRVSTVDGPR